MGHGMLINLVPHRNQPLPPARRRWQRECVAAGMLGFVAGLLGFWWQQDTAQTQQTRLLAERASHATLVKEHTALKQEVSELSARVQQTQHLQSMSTQALAALQLWVPALPPGVVVQSLRQESGVGSSPTPPTSSTASTTAVTRTPSTLLLQGVAPQDDSVAQWLQHLPTSIHGELLELRSTTWPHGAGRLPVQHFTVRLQTAAGS